MEIIKKERLKRWGKKAIPEVSAVSIGALVIGNLRIRRAFLERSGRIRADFGHDNSRCTLKTGRF